jgi:hypothetical protein
MKQKNKRKRNNNRILNSTAECVMYTFVEKKIIYEKQTNAKTKRNC